MAKLKERVHAKSEFEKIKAEVFEFEKRNKSKLVAFQSKGGWWKMGGNSALFYYHQVAPRIGAEPKLNPDRDFYSKFSTGIISIKDLPKLTEKLKEVGIEKVKDAEMIKIFDLGYVTSDEEITTLKKAEGAKRKKVNQVVLPKVVLPDIHVHLMEMSQIAYNQFRNADPMQREYLAADFAKEMRDITTGFILMAKGEIECTEGLMQIKSGLVKIEVMLKLAMELKIWKLDACVRFSDLLIDTNNLVGKEIEKSAAKNKK